MDNEKKTLKWFVKYLFVFLKFPFFIIHNNIDIVHLNIPFDKKGIFRESIFAVFSFLCRKKIIAHFHGGEFFTHHTNSNSLQKLISVFLRFCNQIIVLSNSEKQILESKYACKTDISIIPNCVPSQIKKETLHTVLASKEKNSFIFLGRITKEKGIIEIVETLKWISKYNTHRLIFYLCGIGPCEALVIRELSDVFNVEFHYLGLVVGEEKINYLKKAEYFLLPSYFEGLPMSLLEAMSVGCIPIVTNVGGMPDVVKENETGYVIAQSSADALFKAVNNALKNRDRNAILAENSWSCIETKYNSSNYLILIDNVYAEVLHS